MSFMNSEIVISFAIFLNNNFLLKKILEKAVIIKLSVLLECNINIKLFEDQVLEIIVAQRLHWSNLQMAFSSDMGCKNSGKT